MALKRMVLELGMGTDIRGEDYTKAAIRALSNALRQNSLTIADTLPYGKPEVEIELGGLDTLKANGQSSTIMVNVAVVVYLDLPDDKDWRVAS